MAWIRLRSTTVLAATVSLSGCISLGGTPQVHVIKEGDQAMEMRLQALEQRVDALEGRPSLVGASGRGRLAAEQPVAALEGGPK